MAWDLSRAGAQLRTSRPATSRVGYAPIDPVLIYGRAGFAYANNRVMITNAGS
jgi:hypothetical protein